ncbi:protocadherin gamma-B7-like [Octopus sinensis]|uniref:Protocadherin gamma-B7-like n=1 Tax=Octopus sinensis TaxID=2607531 RepID=A0A6P7U1H4_9MOLL|nr:protocadherin gamma-B7-like [Octopus sinensis]
MLVQLLLFCVPFSSLVFKYSLKEELPIGTEIANLKNDLLDADPHIFDTWDISSLQFSTKNVLAAYLQFTSFGNIKVCMHSMHFQIKQRIDREELCDNSPLCSFVAHVDILQYENWSSRSFQIEFTVKWNLNNFLQILDVNDNPPELSIAFLELEIPFTVNVGFEIRLVNATDKDSSNHSNNKYSLSVKNEFFSVEKDIPTLKITQQIKSRQVFELILMVWDQNNPSFYSELLLVIKITEKLVFWGEFVNVAIINDQMDFGSILWTNEPPITGKCEYLLENPSKNLEIDIQNGKIKLLKRMSAQNQPLIYFVKTTQKNQNFKFTFLLYVKKHFRLKPVIDFMETGNVASIFEKKNHENIKTFRVYYEHSKGPKRAVCFSPSSLVNVVINENLYSVITKTSFDREKTDSVQIPIICSDEGFPSQKTSKTIKVLANL